MLDIKLIRENPDLVRQAITNRHDKAPLDELLLADVERRQKTTELEEMRRIHKEASKQRQQDETSLAANRARRDQMKMLEDTVNQLDEKIKDLLLQLPNIPQPSVPIGASSEDNKVIRFWKEPRKLAFTPLPHWDLGEKLGIIDFEAGSKLSGSRFYVLRGIGSRLQRSLINFFLNLHTTEHGYTEIYPPFMVKKECMVAAGQLPKFADNIYHDAEDDFWFVGTAEIPLTNLHRDTILLPGSLPIHYVAYTACFRREKMSAGKDVRGIKRGHQFDKVELYKFCEPENSNDELESLLANAETVCRKLDLPYRIIELCTGDIGFGSTKSYDIEVWAPGCQEWLEVSSCSNCGDFQARRANIRYRPSNDAKPQFVHTLNGSGLALPRIVIAILENYQQADGSITVPEVLRTYLGTDVIKKY
ncbi:MAG: serine--tRNA ligase [Dehalococcoidales bacterium]|nr:serine--tRNA ligase [Dehalococcoidales bacterium]